jgi:type II secretory ATPase GspE/PulE/Tfp pilus assembly ATPase PilB-like protein
MRTLRDDGVRKALEGVTSLDEVMRVTQEDVVEG